MPPSGSLTFMDSPPREETMSALSLDQVVVVEASQRPILGGSTILTTGGSSSFSATAVDLPDLDSSSISSSPQRLWMLQDVIGGDGGSTTSSKSCLSRSSSVSSVSALSHHSGTFSSSSSPHRQQRKVVFDDDQQVCEIIHVSEYSEEERTALWYNNNDLRSFKRDRRETARRIEERRTVIAMAVKSMSQHKDRVSRGCGAFPSWAGGIPRSRTHSLRGVHPAFGGANDFFGAGNENNDNSDELYCIRGVESLTESGSRLRHAFIADSINTVMNEQELQDQDGKSNPDMLAYVYKCSCEPSLRLALERALGDQQEFLQMRQEFKCEMEQERLQQKLQTEDSADMPGAEKDGVDEAPLDEEGERLMTTIHLTPTHAFEMKLTEL